MSRKLPIPPKEELEDLYLGKLMSGPQLASHYNTSGPTIRKWLKEHGIPKRSHKEATNLHSKKLEADIKIPSKEELLTVLKDNPYTEVCRYFGVGRPRLNEWIDILGIEKEDFHTRLVRARERQYSGEPKVELGIHVDATPQKRKTDAAKYQDLEDKKNKSLSFLNWNSVPKCHKSDCDNEVNFRPMSVEPYGKWSTYCSIQCKNSDPELIKRRRETTIERYGNLSVFQRRGPRTEYEKASQREKAIETNQRLRGVDWHTQTDEYIEKRDATNLERYGTKNTFDLMDPEDRFYYFRTEEGLAHLKSENNPGSIASKKRRYERLTEEISKEFAEIVDKLDIEGFKSFIYSITDDTDTRDTIADKLGITVPRVNGFLRMFGMQDEFLKETFTSAGENEVLEYIKSLGFDCIQSDRKLIHPKELDIYVPSANIAIEYNGIYWHSEGFGRDELYHLDKTISCELNGVQLYHILENEWNDPIKQEIWKSILKKRLIKVPEISEYEVMEISQQEASKFFNKNSLENFKSGNFYYGLQFNDELFAIMILDELNIIQYCERIDVKVVNGLETLVENRFDKLTRYGNRRYESLIEDSNGFLEILPPRCQYFSKETSELLLGDFDEIPHHKVWDSGSIKYEVN